jgi:hypothetical protein
MEYHIYKHFPSEINRVIHQYIYEDKKKMKKHLKKWKEFNVKNLVLFDMIYTSHQEHCFYYLTLWDYNNRPCWLCGEEGHPMKICYKYYSDIYKLKQFLKISSF